MSNPKDLIVARPGETDAEQMLREKINRLSGQMLAAIDAAIEMRTAPPEAQKMRHVSRQNLVNAGLSALYALSVRQMEDRSKT